MNKIKSYTTILGMVLLTCLLHACSDEQLTDRHPADSKDGVLLNLTVNFNNGVHTRLAELPDADAMNDDKNGLGLQHVGLYMYYSDDYADNDLSRPYIRNLKCKVENGCLVPENGEKIYIYDRMRIVAFYPYNASMSNVENYFKTQADEEAYPISKSDYSKQYYIPYRADLETNPTIAYLGQLTFNPKHTSKIEIVLVANEESSFPTVDDHLKILPDVDAVNTGNSGAGFTTDKREKWYDGINKYPDTGAPAGGKYARQYVAYIWTSKKDAPHHENDKPLDASQGDHNHWDNIINKGDIVFTSDKITLISSETVDLSEQQVYRYGYNLDTGEIFIPTSSKLVHDATSLQDISFNKSDAYQVCDIDLSGSGSWTPKEIMDASYDGGGHKITGLTIKTTVTTKDAGNPGRQVFGLFGKINGNSYLRNINLIRPVITIEGSNSTDTCFVGSLCGYINPGLTTAEKDKLFNDGLPDGLSETVKAALRKEMLASLLNTTSHILGCRIEDARITVNGDACRVGTVCGAAGDKDKDGSYYARIWDSYSLDGHMQVNESNNSLNEHTQAGGFCGLNNGYLGRCYTTIARANLVAEFTPATPGSTKTNKAAGFCINGVYFKKSPDKAGINDCYSLTEDRESGVGNFPGAWPAENNWVKYSGRWPVYTNDWMEEYTSGQPSNHPAERSFWQAVGSAPAAYPFLLWENR